MNGGKTSGERGQLASGVFLRVEDDDDAPEVQYSTEVGLAGPWRASSSLENNSPLVHAAASGPVKRAISAAPRLRMTS